MTHAYDEQYLDDAMKNLGEAIDYAVNACKLTADEFMQMFITTGFSAKFGNGTPKVVSGMSGTELVNEVVRKSGTDIFFPQAQTEYDYSPEYWCGWILAYYQWYTGRTFKDIMNIISMEKIEKMYPTLHEAPEEKFINTVNGFIRRKKLPTQLQRLRKLMGYSQKTLADKSGVNLRTIQQYEIRAKDINKAAASTLAAISKVLGCSVEDLLEYDIRDIEENEK